MRAAPLALVGLALMVGTASGQQIQTGKDNEGHAYMQTAAGLALYVYDNDAKNAVGTDCTGPCAKHWPAFKAETGAQAHGDWSVMQRVDGSGIQWLYKGRPLYTFDGDKAPGDRNGNSFEGNKWHLAQP